jgi:hypothetical protein
MMAAAKELAQRPETSGNIAAQNRICRKYGIYIEDMTKSELDYFSSLINDFL